MNIGDKLTRKLGPLPAWGWGVALGGAYLVYKFVRGGSSPQVVQVTGTQPGGSMDAGQAGMSGGDLTSLEGQIAGLQGQLNTIFQNQSQPGTSGTSATPPPTSSYNEQIAQLRDKLLAMYPTYQDRWTVAGKYKLANETQEQAYHRIFGGYTTATPTQLSEIVNAGKG